MHISTEHHAFWRIGGEALNKHPEQTKKGLLKSLFFVATGRLAYSISSFTANAPGLVILIFSWHCSHTISPAKSCTFSLASHKVHGRGNFTTFAALTISVFIIIYPLKASSFINKFQPLNVKNCDF